jgi:predicted phosphodiesterase
MKVTLISDTHTKHRNCELDLPGGDLLIHAGDFMNSGYEKRKQRNSLSGLIKSKHMIQKY